MLTKILQGNQMGMGELVVSEEMAALAAVLAAGSCHRRHPYTRRMQRPSTRNTLTNKLRTSHRGNFQVKGLAGLGVLAMAKDLGISGAWTQYHPTSGSSSNNANQDAQLEGSQACRPVDHRCHA